MENISPYTPDRLGRGYECRRIHQPDDYAGPVDTVIVRRLPEAASQKAVLYVHGFSDYFLQHEMGVEFNSHGYAFYAVDLRKYGRAKLPEQRFFEVRDLHEYFADIDAAIAVMRAEGIKHIVLMGHSTGGLTASLYMSEEPSDTVGALVLNSPFLAWNLKGLKRAAVPVLAAIGRFAPGLVVRQPDDTRYARSLRKGIGGEWEYETEWKPDRLPDVDAGWVRAIEMAQRTIRRGAAIRVPVLVLTSGASAAASDPFERFMEADGVLDVAKIRKVAPRLGPDVTLETVEGGLHDLLLSRKPVRDAVYYDIFDWLGSLKEFAGPQKSAGLSCDSGS